MNLPSRWPRLKLPPDLPARIRRAWYRGRVRAQRVSEQLQALAGRCSGYARLMRLDRPVGIWLLLWPTLWALWIAGDGRPDEHVFIVFMLGTVLLRSAGCVINDIADRRIDPHVARTRTRPLATGEVSVPEALALAAGLLLIALGLVLTLNRLTIQLALVGAAVTVIYPFMKRYIATPQLVLGVAFAWGVPMAFAAELGEVPRVGWLLFTAALIWVVVYDTQYAMVDRDDDIRLGVQSTAILFGEMDRAVIGGLQLLALLGLALTGQSAELGAWFFFGLVLAAALALYQQFLIAARAQEDCFRAFLNNVWFGGVIYAGILLHYVFRG
jgi:4-hydroxybenzoate polyprenyltransferase